MIRISRLPVVSLLVLSLNACQTSGTSPPPTSRTSEQSTAPQQAGDSQIDAQRPTLNPGDRWIYSTHAERFITVKGEKLQFEIEREGQTHLTVYRDKNLTSIPGEGPFDPPAGSLDFPLRVGDKWSHLYTYEGVGRHAWYQVIKREQITVRGTSYDAFHIVGTDKRLDRRNGMNVQIYYSPDVRGIVKLQRQDNNLDAVKRQDSELIRFQPALR